MLGACPIIAFAATANPPEAIRFYRDILGLRIVAEETYAVVFDSAGTMLRVAITRDVKPPPYTILGWRVPDISAVVKSLAAAGVVMERYGFLQQDENGVWTSPGGGRVAWFKDPDGNLLSVTQFKD